MIIVFLCGGLGNQMFQYAAARRLAETLKTELKLELTDYRGGVDQRPAGLEAFRRRVAIFDLCTTGTEATPQEIARLKDPFTRATTKDRIVRQLRRFNRDFLRPATDIREKGYRFDASILQLKGNIYLHGYWQSEKYFADIAPLIRQEFAPKDAKIRKYAREYVDGLRQGGGPIVSLHVRRGDLAVAHESLNKGNLVYGKPVSVGYISAAVTRFDADHRFLVFSDTAKDIAWCRQHLRGEGIPENRLLFSEGHPDVQDMAIMSACDHHIIANSTFSWWGAWLNPSPTKRVIAPSVWATPRTPNSIVTDDLIPPGWVMI